MPEYIFKALLITSLTGTVLTLILTLINPLTKKYFSSGWHYYIWLIVLISMILPVRLAIPENNSFVPPVSAITHDYTEQDTHSVYIPDENTADAHGIIQDKINVLSAIWLLGMGILIIFRIIGYIAFLIKVRNCSEIISCDGIKHFTDRKITVKASDKILSPLMFGLIKPVLLLPKTAMTEVDFNNVLTHEMTHFKRKDILYKWFVCIVKCIHWFNPIIYYVSRQINIECEISCDLEVVKGMSKEQEISYINTILTLLSAKSPKTATITTAMVSDAKSLKRRFTMIKNKFNISKKAVIISAVLTLLLLGGTVFASGILNGALLDKPEAPPTNDEPVLVVKPAENREISYNRENGEIISAVSEPKLMPDSNNKSNPESKSISSSARTDKADSSDIVLQEITVEESFLSPCEGQIAMTFGKREHPITKETSAHNGIDIVAPEGTNVVSSINGKVTEVGYNSEKGNYVVVERDNIKTVYSQLATTNVKKGDSINSSQSIGTVGNTGNSTGAHLHFEVIIDGEYCDPESLIK